MSDFDCIWMPMAAMSDKRLSATDMRVLATISQHNGTTEDGGGPVRLVTYKVLAEGALCKLQSAERSVENLKAYGYLVLVKTGDDGRKMGLRLSSPNSGSSA